MSYVLSNLSDSQLDELSAAVHAERRRRWEDKMDTSEASPIAETVKQCKWGGLSRVDAIREVRMVHGLNPAEAFFATEGY